MSSEPTVEIDAWMAEANRGHVASVAAEIDVDATLRAIRATANERLRVIADRKPHVGVDAVVQYVPRADRVSPALAARIASTPPAVARTDAVFARLKTDAFHELVEASMAGDNEAWGTLIAWINPAIVRYCRARIGRTGSAYSNADDVAQEIMLAILGALPRYSDDRESFLPFVYGIASHKVADYYRRSGRDRTDPVADTPDGPDDDPGPEQVTLRAEMRNRLAALLECLAPRQREILVLRVVVGLSAQETAAAIGLSATAVRIAQHRALTRLRGSLTAADWL